MGIETKGSFQTIRMTRFHVAKLAVASCINLSDQASLGFGAALRRAASSRLKMVGFN